jgi:hypothetical protein
LVRGMEKKKQGTGGPVAGSTRTEVHGWSATCSLCPEQMVRRKCSGAPKPTTLDQSHRVVRLPLPDVALLLGSGPDACSLRTSVPWFSHRERVGSRTKIPKDMLLSIVLAPFVGGSAGLLNIKPTSIADHLEAPACACVTMTRRKATSHPTVGFSHGRRRVSFSPGHSLYF